MTIAHRDFIFPLAAKERRLIFIAPLPSPSIVFSRCRAMMTKIFRQIFINHREIEFSFWHGQIESMFMSRVETNTSTDARRVGGGDLISVSPQARLWEPPFDT